MIQRTGICEILSGGFTGSVVTVYGWVRTSRSGKNVAFAALNDGSSVSNLQVVFDRVIFGDESLAGLQAGACVCVTGTVVESTGEQAVELAASSLEVVGPVDSEFPLQKKRHGLDFLRTMPHLRSRTNTFGAVFRMSHHLSLAIHRFFDTEGFYHIHTPIITESDCEGAGETFQVTTQPHHKQILKFAEELLEMRKNNNMDPRISVFDVKFDPVKNENALTEVYNVLDEVHRFLMDPECKPSNIESFKKQLANIRMLSGIAVNSVNPNSYGDDYFRRRSFLSVSGQLEAEPFALSLGKVYTFGPTFRADPSDTRTHAAEFWMIEPEMSFFDLDDNIALIERFVKFCASYLREKCAADIAFFSEHYEKGLGDRYRTLEDGFARVSYTEAISILGGTNGVFSSVPSWGDDLATEHERYLAEKHFGRPVFVTDYPASMKPFYMFMNPDGKTVAACDLLVPGVGEIVGGSQREHRLDHLHKRAVAQGLDLSVYAWYLELRRWGSAPHAGFGLGFERLLMYLTGMENIRDVIPFPRTFGKMY
jgi:asparaginyl-tRNA synthetase